MEELGGQEQACRDTEQSHEGKDNGNGRSILNKEDSKEEDNLEASEHVDTLGGHVLGEGFVRELVGLLEKEQEAVPELDSRHRRETHEKEDSQQDRERDFLECVQEQERKTDQQVGEKISQACLLDADYVSVLILLGQIVQVNNARNGSGD